MIGIELNSESEIASSMCTRSVLSASLGSFIFFNESELGSHFSSLSVLLCLIQIEIIGGAQAPPAPRLPTALVSEGKIAVCEKTMMSSEIYDPCEITDHT